MKVELTDRFLRNLKPPEAGRIEVSDTKRPGLRFRLTSRGKATWMFEKRVKGGPKRKHTLGTWPEPVSLADARSQSLIIEAEAAQGIDRVADREAARLEQEVAKAKQVSVREVIEAYDRLHPVTLRTRDERLRQLNEFLSPQIEGSITKLTRSDLQKAVDAKAASGRKVYANRVRAALKAFTRWAWLRGYMPEDVGAGLARATKETARERVLSTHEMRAIWSATFEMGGLWGPFLRVLILTCQRRGEVLKLRWSDIDLERRRILVPGSRTKNGKPQITHLSRPAWLELASMHEVRGESDLIFTTTGKTPLSGIAKAKAKLDGLLPMGFEPWRLHDIRTAFATAMVDAGVPESVADRVLNHSASGSAPSAVARVYNQSEQLPQRAAALDRWADLVTDKAASVVPLENHREKA